MEMLARAQKVTAGFRHPASCSHVVLSTPQTLTGRLAALKIQDDCFSPAFQDRDIHPGEMSTIAQALKPLIRGYSDPEENVHACTTNTVSQVCFPERRHKGAKTELWLLLCGLSHSRRHCQCLSLVPGLLQHAPLGWLCPLGSH